MQKMKGLWHPVAYFSKKFNPTESNYPIHDKEMLAIVFANGMQNLLDNILRYGQTIAIWLIFERSNIWGKDKCVGPMN